MSKCKMMLNDLLLLPTVFRIERKFVGRNGNLDSDERTPPLQVRHYGQPHADEIFENTLYRM